MSIEDFNKVGSNDSSDNKSDGLEKEDGKFSQADSIFEQGLNELEKVEASASSEEESKASVTDEPADEIAEEAVEQEESPVETSSDADSDTEVDSISEVEVVEASAEEEATEEEPEPIKPKNTNPDLRWFVVNAYSSFEAKAKRALEDRINNSKIAHLFGEVRVPEETVVELVRGQKKTASRKFFPGYMLVQMVMNEHTWHLVTNTPKISGFIGDKANPLPLDQTEVDKILQQVEEGAASPVARLKFNEGDTVKVIDGPFSDFNGTVEDVSPEKGKLKVLISIFGRATPVELDFVQVEKVTG